jgi:hypothetical protein
MTARPRWSPPRIRRVVVKIFRALTTAISRCGLCRVSKNAACDGYGVQWMERVKRCVVVMGGMCLGAIEVAYLAAEERSLGIGVGQGERLLLGTKRSRHQKNGRGKCEKGWWEKGLGVEF